MIPIHSPTHKPREKFENLSIHFPEGTVINLRFHRKESKNISGGKCEETYRLVDIGIGLEFAGAGAEALREIEKNLKPFSRSPE